MEISKAALPPIQPTICDKDRSHPLYPLYQQHRAFCSNNLITASSFDDWLFQYERDRRNDEIAKHPRFKEWQAWMGATKAGARPCCPSEEMPRGLSFPANFHFWLEGGRW